MTIALLIALFISGSTSLVAENALPGDVLYPVKVSVNEEVRNLIAVSDEAQANWDARRVERRLEEAEKLAVEGRLDAEVSADIESRFEDNEKAFRESVAKIEAKQDAQTSFEVNSNFEASLRAHEQVLARMAAKEADAETESLLLGVRNSLGVTTKARVDAEAKMSVDADTDFKMAAEGKLKAAENKVSEVSDFIARAKSSVDVSAHAQAEAKLKVAADVILRGKAEVEAQAYSKAFASFQEALRTAQEAKLLVASEGRLNLEIDDRNDGADVEGKTESEVKSEFKQEESSEASVNVELKVKAGTEGGSAETEGRGVINLGL